MSWIPFHGAKISLNIYIDCVLRVTGTAANSTSIQLVCLYRILLGSNTGMLSKESEAAHKGSRYASPNFNFKICQLVSPTHVNVFKLFFRWQLRKESKRVRVRPKLRRSPELTLVFFTVLIFPP